MTETTPESEPKTQRTREPEDIEDAVVVEDENSSPEVVKAEIVQPSGMDSAEAESTTAAAAGEQRIIYVATPAAPRKLGNRGAGAGIAVASAVVFAAILAGLTIILRLLTTGTVQLGFLAQAEFYIPALFFVIGFVLLVLLANRANWWAYIVGSILVGVLVYVGTIGLILLSTDVILDTPVEAADRLAAQLRNPFIIGAAFLAREVSMWTGVLISRRGRRLKMRNAEARGAYDRDLAEKRAEHERGAAPAAPAA